MKKNSITLIEVLIVLSLFVLLSSVLFSSFFNSVLITNDSLSAKKMAAEQIFVSQRIKSTLGKFFIEKDEVLNKENALFYTDKNQLIFTYNNGIDKDPKYSGRVFGKLYLGREGGLYLEIKPSLESYEKREELLLESVQECLFEFYTPPPKKVLEIDPQKIGDGTTPPLGSVREWEKTYRKLPQSVKIILKQKIENKLSTLIFPILLSTPIIYVRD